MLGTQETIQRYKCNVDITIKSFHSNHISNINLIIKLPALHTIVICKLVMQPKLQLEAACNRKKY